MIPDVSAGSNHVGASEMCTAQIIWPADASARPAGASGAPSLGDAPAAVIARTTNEAKRPRTCSFMEASCGRDGLFVLESHILVRSREYVAGDQADSRLLDPWPHAAESGVQPDGRHDRLVVDHLLDSVQGRLAPLRIELTRLLTEEPVDIGIASVDVGATGGHEGLDPGGRVAVPATAALDEALVLLVGPTLEEGRALERPELQADADGVEAVDD